MFKEVAAFEESFGDISAILCGLQVPSLRDAILVETDHRIYRSSRLSKFAEQMGWGFRQNLPATVEPDCLRNAVNSFFYKDIDTLSLRCAPLFGQIVKEIKFYDTL